MRGHAALLPGLPHELILKCYTGAPGNEIESGKFDSPESSAALVVNTFGYFLDKPGELPPVAWISCAWPAKAIWLERIVRFPWRGGRHPCLDVLVETEDTLIGIESKRYEPFRSKLPTVWPKSYSRDVWGNQMSGFISVREALLQGDTFAHLDAGQLITHAFGLRSAVNGRDRFAGKRAYLVYLYADPPNWPDGRSIESATHVRHRDEISRFGAHVAGDEVTFLSLRYSDLLATWKGASPSIAQHAIRVEERFFSARGGSP